VGGSGASKVIAATSNAFQGSYGGATDGFLVVMAP